MSLIVCIELTELLLAGRPKAALLFWFFRDFRCGVLLLIVLLVIYKYRNRLVGWLVVLGLTTL